jgi:hypothetical protein
MQWNVQYSYNIILYHTVQEYNDKKYIKNKKKIKKKKSLVYMVVYISFIPIEHVFAYAFATSIVYIIIIPIACLCIIHTPYVMYAVYYVCMNTMEQG